jgi:hypothetical protein
MIAERKWWTKCWFTHPTMPETTGYGITDAGRWWLSEVEVVLVDPYQSASGVHNIYINGDSQLYRKLKIWKRQNYFLFINIPSTRSCLRQTVDHVHFTEIPAAFGVHNNEFKRNKGTNGQKKRKNCKISISNFYIFALLSQCGMSFPDSLQAILLIYLRCPETSQCRYPGR